MTRRSTVGTAGDCAVARPARRESPPTVKIPVPTAPCGSTSRRLMAASWRRVRGDYDRAMRPMSINAPASSAGGALEHGRIVENRRSLNETHDDLPVEPGHGVTGRSDPVGQRVTAVAVLADVVACEILVDQRLHPGVRLLGELDHLGALHRAVGAETDGHAYRAVDGVLGHEDRRGDESALLVAPEIEAIEILVRRPARLLLDRLAFGRRQAYFADEESAGAGGQPGRRLSIRRQPHRRRYRWWS